MTTEVAQENHGLIIESYTLETGLLHQPLNTLSSCIFNNALISLRGYLNWLDFPLAYSWNSNFPCRRLQMAGLKILLADN